MQPGSLRAKGKPSSLRRCRSNQRPRPAANRSPRRELKWFGMGPLRPSTEAWRPLVRRTTQCGLPWMTSVGRYFLFSPHSEQTTKIELAGKLSVPANTSWPHFLQQTTQDLGKGRARIRTTIGEEKGKIKGFGNYPLT